MAPVVWLAGAQWVARLDRANITPRELWVERETGRMQARELAESRAPTT